MDAYGTEEAAEVLNLSPSRVRALVRAGVVTPARTARGAFRFGFRDLVLLRVAATLLGAGIPSRRVIRSLAGLRRRLPDDRSLSELRIVADGTRILVQEGTGSYEAESGQFVLDFRVAELAARVAPLRPDPAESADAETWYRFGMELEDRDPARARAAYERAVVLDPAYADALVNLGRLHHEAGHTARAAGCYRRALEAQPGHATAAYNLGVALEDEACWSDAVDAYRLAITLQPTMADAHYNLANALQHLGDRQAALRSLRRYRELKGSPAAR